MIIVALKGGLGNQLFQYACGRALSIRNNDALKLDVTGYGEWNGIDTMRHYTLDKFDIKAGLATSEEIKKLKYPLGIVSKGWRFFKFKLLRRFNVGFHPRILRQKNDIYLDGFWQTYRYMHGLEDSIRRDLALKEPLSPAAESLARSIKNKKTLPISLHVRRGDYISSPRENAYHGSYGNDYYARALARMKDELIRRGVKAENIRIFVFSDGMDWVKENIVIPFPTTYVPDEIPDYEQLVLMSMCSHHIIANSSFSWWGAWLDPKPDKIVIAPRRWVKRSEWRHKDTVPKEWVRV